MKKVVTIGGGTGTFNLVSALKHIDGIFINTVVSMSDDGGSTGFLRDEYGILPPGDLRRALVALADDEKTEFLRKLFAYRFDSGFLKGQNLGNLIMFAAENLEKDYGKALNKLEELFEIKKGKVYPSTLEKTRLLAQLENGEFIIGETNIDIPRHDGNIKISSLNVIKEDYAKILSLVKKLKQNKIFNLTLQEALQNKPKENPVLEDVIQQADYIIFGPGDLYTSILPNILVGNMVNLIKNSKAKKIYVSNLFTKFGETTDFKLSDFLNVFNKIFSQDIFDYILVQNESKLNIPMGILQNYKSEGKDLVKIDVNSEKILKVDIVSTGLYLRHDKFKLSKVFEEIFRY